MAITIIDQDPFNSVLPIWTDVQTAGTISVSGGEKIVAKNGSNGWDVCAYIRNLFYTPNFDDIFELTFSLDQVGSNVFTRIGWGRYQHNGSDPQGQFAATPPFPAPFQAAQIGVYCFQAGGQMRMHANVLGNINNFAQPMLASTQYTIQLRWDNVSDTGPNLYYKGGNFGSSFIFLDTLDFAGNIPIADNAWAHETNVFAANTTARVQDYKIFFGEEDDAQMSLGVRSKVLRDRPGLKPRLKIGGK